jgi:DNA repair protein RecN (Recombination protein N)
MLLEIYISNFVLIDNVRIAFQPGLTVLSGETGAGKSIVIDALGLILGDRAQKELVRDADRAAVAEASFDISGLPQLQGMLAEKGFLEQDESLLVLSREIVAGGKNLARLNGRIITAAQLRQISAWLLDMHLQHDHLSILKPHMYLQYLDRCGPGAPALLRQVEGGYQLLQKRRQELEELQSLEQTKLQRIDFLSYQISEIQSVHLRADEEEELQTTRDRIRNLEKFRAATERLLELLYTQEQGQNAYDLISTAIQLVQPLNDPFFEPVKAALQEVCFTIEETAGSVSAYKQALEDEPYVLDEVESRLHLIQRLKSRYGQNITEILRYLENAQQELEYLQNDQTRQEDLRREISALERDYLHAAEQLSQLRKQAARKLEEQVHQQLSELNMPHLKFEVRVLDSEASSTGINRVELMFSPNPGEEMKPLQRVASGGEISRFVLALKIVLAGIYDVPTLVFDEIDAGVGGRSLTAMARKLANLSHHYQVLMVTHAPAIASVASHHYLISKEIEGERTVTRLRLLDFEERIQELARMLAGDNISQLTLEHARQMLSEGQQWQNRH